MVSRRETGQAAVELALLMPILLLILLGCLDLGRAFSVWLALANGAREGARYGCLYPTDQAGIVAAAREDLEAEGLAGDAVGVQVVITPGAPSGSPIAVTTSYTFPLTSSYLLGTPNVAIRARTQMMIVGGS